MAQPLNPHNGVHSLNKLSFCYNSFSSTTAKSKLLQKAKSCFYRRYDTLSRCQHCAQSISPGLCWIFLFDIVCLILSLCRSRLFAGVLNVDIHVKRTPEFEVFFIYLWRIIRDMMCWIWVDCSVPNSGYTSMPLLGSAFSISESFYQIVCYSFIFLSFIFFYDLSPFLLLLPELYPFIFSLYCYLHNKQKQLSSIF